MREGRPSLTSALVAFARGIGPPAGAGGAAIDPVAARLVPGPLALVLERLGRGGLRAAALGRALRASSLGLVEHLVLRTRLIDDAVREGIGAGARQLVILGAGLDARALRLEVLADVSVFEVDHPATQAYKRARVARLAPRPGALTFVPVDFERESLAERLAAAGHDPAAPTFWIWEGVTPYLRPAAIDSTLEEIARRSAGGSRIVLSYLTPELLLVRRGPRRAALVALRAVGEPVLGAMEPAEVAQRLVRVGFEPVWDRHPRDLAPPGRAPLLAPDERLALAEKRPGPGRPPPEATGRRRPKRA